MLLEAGLDVNARTIADCPTHLHIGSKPRQSRLCRGLARRRSVIDREISEKPGPHAPDCVTNKNDNKFRRIVPMLLRAGSDMPPLDRLPYGGYEQPFPDFRPFTGTDRRILQKYLKKIFEVRPWVGGPSRPTRRLTGRSSRPHSCPSSPRSPRRSCPRSSPTPSTRAGTNSH